MTVTAEELTRPRQKNMKSTILKVFLVTLGIVPIFADEVSLPGQSGIELPVQNKVSNAYEIDPYFGVSGVFGKFDEKAITPAIGESGDYDVAGVRINGGFFFGNGFSIDGRYEHAEGDLLAASIESDEVRLSVNYEQEILQGFALCGGIGYGLLNHFATMPAGRLSLEGVDLRSLELSGDGLLLVFGAKFSDGEFFGSLIYTHAFTNSADIEVNGASVPNLSSVDLVDVGVIEMTTGYYISEHLSAKLSIELQITGETWIEKSMLAAIGFQLDF